MERHVGRYRLLKRIAAGGMGEVYLAAQSGPEGFSKVVALKRMLPVAAAERELVRAFLDEARLVAKLSHRNIAQIFELGEDAEGYYLALEYVAGASLRGLLDRLEERRERLAPALAVDIAADIAEALGYAASAVGIDGAPLMIVHRDVSPHNVLVSGSGDVKLIDFGVAKSRQQQHATERGFTKGKLAYMSPEQSQARELDGRSDLFALGVVLCELLTGKHPFDRGDVVQTLLAMQAAPPRLPSADDPALRGLDAVISRALEKAPHERFADGQEFADALRAVRAQLPRPPQRLGQLVGACFAVEIAALARVIQENRSGTWDANATAGALEDTAPSVAHDEPVQHAAPDARAVVSEPLPPAALAPPMSGVEAGASMPTPVSRPTIAGFRLWRTVGLGAAGLAVAVVTIALSRRQPPEAVEPEPPPRALAPRPAVDAAVPAAVAVAIASPVPAVDAGAAPRPTGRPRAVRQTGTSPKKPVLFFRGPAGPAYADLGPDGSSVVLAGAATAFRVTLEPSHSGGTLLARLTTEPWAIVTVDGVSVGKTPVELNLSKALKVELKSPTAGAAAFELWPGRL